MAEKLPPYLEKTCSMHTVNRTWDRPTLLKFKDWLKDKVEAHEKRKLSSGKPKTENSKPFSNVTKTKTGTKILASTSSSETPSIEVKAKIYP